MAHAEATLIGLYQFDNSIFDEMTMPDGISAETVKNTILMNCGEMEIYYINPTILKTLIGIWSVKWQSVFKKWYTALSIEYEPLENYNRVENITTTYGKKQSYGGEDGIESTTGYENSGKDTNSNSDVTNNYASAFNSSSVEPIERTVVDYGKTVSSNNSGKNSDTQITTYAHDVTDSGKDIVENKTHGNIGVTTSQQMLKDELEIAKWNLYEHISDVFMREFCLLVY